MSDTKPVRSAFDVAQDVVPLPSITDRFGGHVAHAFEVIKNDRLMVVGMFVEMAQLAREVPAEGTERVILEVGTEMMFRAANKLRKLIESEQLPEMQPPDFCRCPAPEITGTAAGFARGERGTCRKCGKEPG